MYSSIQCLRAIAAISVILYHSHIAVGPEAIHLINIPLFTDHGDLGVDLFFVVSGFIIANIISNGETNRAVFFWRRFWRIMPLYTFANCVALLAYFRLGWYRFDVDDLGISGVIKSFLIIPQELKPLLNPGWTLVHEVLFYLLAGAIAPLFGLRAVFAALIGLATVGLTISGWKYGIFSDMQYDFACGIIAYWLRDVRLRYSAPALVAFTVAALSFTYGAFHLGVFLASFLIGGWFAALIVFLLGVEKQGFAFPKVLVLLGNWSFSLYLMHWLMISISIKILNMAHFPDWFETRRWIAALSAFPVAYVTYTLIERPAIKWARNQERRFSAKEAAPAAAPIATG